MSLPTAQTGTNLFEVGAFFLRGEQLFQITAWDPQAPLKLEARALADSALHHFSLTELFAPTPLTRFGASPAALLGPAAPVPVPPVDASGLPAALLSRAAVIIQTVETVERQRTATRQRWRLEATTGSLRAATQEFCAALPQPISLSQYYTYRRLYLLHGGDCARIAASLRRSSFQKSRLDPNTQHFVDTILRRFYRSSPPLRAQTVFHLLRQLWTHTRHWWLNLAQVVPDDQAQLIDQFSTCVSPSTPCSPTRTSSPSSPPSPCLRAPGSTATCAGSVGNPAKAPSTTSRATAKPTGTPPSYSSTVLCSRPVCPCSTSAPTTIASMSCTAMTRSVNCCHACG